ncbi:hypothetical protein H2199_004689 [Coniosporium tulheliwenetii]|uniref:Uncharacterized protein n=1 Tax=Coniosporium tulheliwenetii TaxID=3383036 RepID=A0ACC2Z3L7_9PEZI|nr:hypothetical protein H2199_004689 [Cladosporium sp. JES 115]
MEIARPASHTHLSRSRSRSRRSHPNLHHLSLAPLSSTYLASDTHEDYTDRLPRSSYIQSATAPTTPGILSRSTSPTHSRRRGRQTESQQYQHESYFLTTHPNPNAGITKAKSSSALLATHPSRLNAPAPASAAGKTALSPYARVHASKTTEPAEDSWLHRAGLAIATSTREDKGQSWLVRRASSTSSLPGIDGAVDSYIEPHANHNGALGLADDELSPQTPRYSRPGSRFATPGKGSKIELMTPAAGVKTPGSAEKDTGYFETDTAAAIEPDFVGLSGEDAAGEVADEEEVARLAREAGFGLGGWVDRLIGWSVFRVQEEGEEGDSETETEVGVQRNAFESEEELRRRLEEEREKRREERERMVAASREAVKETKALKEGKEEGVAGCGVVVECG